MDNQQESIKERGWVELPTLTGYYTDVDGKIYSVIKNKNGRKLNPYQHYGKSKNPYMRVRVNKKLFLVHRLVASVKIGRPLNTGEQVNHINGVTTDNRMTNLEVVSQQENIQHAVKAGLYSSGPEWYAARGITKIL